MLVLGVSNMRDAAAALQGVVRAYEQGADFKRLAEDVAEQARNLVLAGLPVYLLWLRTKKPSAENVRNLVPFS